MPFITFPVNRKTGQQITFADMLSGIIPDGNVESTYDTRTIYEDRVSEKFTRDVDFGAMSMAIADFCTKYKGLIETEDRASLFRSFKIPKRSGGLRQIDAPLPELDTAIRELKKIFDEAFRPMYHSSAFAFIKGRSTISAVKRHQANRSKWFLKLDLHDFFGSTTPSFLVAQLKRVYPFSEAFDFPYFADNIWKAVSLCFLPKKAEDGTVTWGLCQGTPLSPTLTNIMMIPIDYEIARYCQKDSHHIVYTRYADDMIFSAQQSFMWTTLQNKVCDILRDYRAPFSINKKKTHYGSINGRNWMLGVMLNKDNQITIGHAEKKTFKTMLHCYATAKDNGETWSLEDLQHLQGLISYYEMVEGDTIRDIIRGYSDKHGFDIEATVKQDIGAYQRGQAA